MQTDHDALPNSPDPSNTGAYGRIGTVSRYKLLPQCRTDKAGFLGWTNVRLGSKADAQSPPRNPYWDEKSVVGDATGIGCLCG